MKITVINKDKIDNIPPLISVIMILTDLGHEVHLITGGISENINKIFEERNVKIETYNFIGAKNPLHKIIQYIKYRRTVGKRIKEIPYDLLWIEGANTIVALGNKIKGHKYILQISELHEKSKLQLNAIGNVIQNAKMVFMPEYNRCILYQVWFQLKQRPRVLVNKPYFIPSKEELKKYELQFSDYLKVFNEKKVILYQGWISPDRDLSNYILATKELGNDFRFVLLGRDQGMLDKYKKLDKNLIHIDFIPAPQYLTFTSKAHIGILSYDGLILNNAYCAPNKIYEYSAFGLPMIGNDIPGLTNSIAYNNAGCVVDEDSIESIKNGIETITNNYEFYSQKALELNEKADNKEIIRKALNDIQIL